MVKTYKQPGDVVTLTAPAAVVSGQFLKIGSIVGVSTEDYESGASMELMRVGVHSPAPKATGQAWTEGLPLYWDDTAKNFTSSATGNLYCAQAVKAAASAATTGEILLVPGDKAVG